MYKEYIKSYLKMVFIMLPRLLLFVISLGLVIMWRKFLTLFGKKYEEPLQHIE